MPMFVLKQSSGTCILMMNTFWFGFTVMNHQQHQPQMTASTTMSQQSHPTPNPQASLLNMPNALTSQQQQQQKLRLQRIQMERERIRMRQEELLRQVLCLVYAHLFGAFACLVSELRNLMVICT